MKHTDFLIVGAGIVGLSIARALSRRFPDAAVTVLEKEAGPAYHASGRNSGVLHAGFYYDADSLKARFTVAGNQALTTFCLEHGLPIRQCGKVVVAVTEAEVAGIRELKRRGDVNGVTLHHIDEKTLAEIEPNAKTVQEALFSPTTASVDPNRVVAEIIARFPKTVRIRYGTRLAGIVNGNRARLEGGGKLEFSHLFNAAGLYADRVAEHFGAGTKYTMMPFKGVYLPAADDSLLRCHVYPVPNLKHPFLGVHFTKTVDGHVKIGPTAIPAFWRENYDFTRRFRAGEFLEILFRQSLLFAANDFNFRSLAIEEMRKYNRRFFIGQAKKLVREMDETAFGDYLRPGIRAQLMDTQTRRLVMDFVIEPARRSTHVLNAVSPAFTTAFPFAEHIVDSALSNI
jgi:L-2-hydroxyglutarate oxidase LhgO